MFDASLVAKIDNVYAAAASKRIFKVATIKNTL